MNPEIFTENNEDSAEFYTKFTPEESAEIIRDHVKEGAVLAEKHRIPKEVVDIIWQHHGTSYIRYSDAQRQGKVEDLDAFRYPPPAPEQGSRFGDVGDGGINQQIQKRCHRREIAKLIDDTIQRLIRTAVRRSAYHDKGPCHRQGSMCPVLESVFRKRLEYPEENNLEPPDLHFRKRDRYKWGPQPLRAVQKSSALRNRPG